MNLNGPKNYLLWANLTKLNAEEHSWIINFDSNLINVKKTG